MHCSAVETSFSFIYPSAVRLYMCVCIFSSSDFGKYCFEILLVGYIYSQVLFIKIAWFDIININEN